MNKCRLCQQVNNNLTHVHSNRIKSLAQIILKLKGFEDSLDFNHLFKICGKCKQGIENVSTFWENIPEAMPILEELHDENEDLHSASKPCIPAITSTIQKQLEYDAESTNAETCKLEPIKIQIKLPRKRKRQNKPLAVTTTTKSLPKRIRRCPKRYQDFDDVSTNKNIIASDENSNTDNNICSETTLNNLPLVALLRLNDGLDIGKLVEVDSNGASSRIRIVCLICYKVFCHEKPFQQHFKTHNKYRCEDSADLMKNYFYYCKLCDKSYETHYAVRRHFSSAHSEDRPLKCQYCEASFKYHFNLDYHMAKHVPKKLFECVFCKKKFIKRYELKIHLRTHTKERPYKCEYCPFASAHRSNLKTHHKTKHLNNKCSQDCKEFINIVETPPQVFIPPLALVEDDKEILPNLNDENLSDFTFTRSDVQDFPSDLNHDNDEVNLSETENNSLPNIPIDDDVKLTTTNDNNISESAHLNESSKENLISQAILGTFKLDCSILKSLPSSTILDLKKWPKSFQSIPLSPELERSCAATNSADPLKSIVKYTSAAKYSSENSLQVANYNMMGNGPSTSSPCAANCNSSISNTKTLNFEVSSPTTLKANDEIINISKLPETFSIKQHHVDNELKTTETISDMQTKNVSLETSDSQSWKVIKFSDKPVRIRNILNLKTAPMTNSTKSDKVASYECKNVINISNESSTDQCLQLSETNVNSQASSSISSRSSKPLSKYQNNSQRSLLKPILKTQEIFNLSLSNHNEKPITLTNKPLITNIETLPPLNMVDILPKTSSATATTTNLIRPPIDYKHQCQYCYKYFKQKTALTRHIRTHTGEKPYKCNLCPKSFADASNYKKHKILHKNAAEALNVSGSVGSYAVQSSPAYSTVSDPDPDGIEIMQTLKRFECSSTEDDDDIDDASTTSSALESNMWQDVLEHALNNNEWRENLKRNLTAINNAILPKPIQTQTQNTANR